MRNLHLEAAIWYLFTSAEFFEAAARECEETMDWFGTLAISKRVANFGRNGQIFDKFKDLAANFRRGAELAQLGDYQLIWDTASSVGGNVRGMMEQPLRSWMTEDEYQEFSRVKINRLTTRASLIESALNNAITGADSFFEQDPDCPERSNDDDGFPGDDIVSWYYEHLHLNSTALFPSLPDPLPEYLVDTSITCQAGDEVPWTGVWYPSTGLENHSLTFAVNGLKMQPAYRVTKTVEELEGEGVLCPIAETVAVATAWHPVKPSSGQVAKTEELWTKEGELCPKTGVWQPTDPGAAPRSYERGETMASLKSAFGLTVWRWVSD